MSAASLVIDLPEARSIALDAQGFSRPRRAERDYTMRDVQAVISQLGQFQIDTINVVERAHYFPLFSRLGNYDKALLERALGRSPRRLFEYWGHAASMIDVDLQPALRPRMMRNARQPWAGYARTLEEYPGLEEKVLAEVRARGPLTARQVEHDEGERTRENWGWNWSAVKHVLEGLFSAGEISSANRNPSFERLYDLPERVLPARVLAVATPGEDEARLELVRRSARALGVASAKCLADYFRLPVAATGTAIQQLVASRELVPVEVRGWSRPTWLWHEYVGARGVRVPPPSRARALVSPFDSLVFERTRTLELFGMFYRIEIYVPEARRQYGYYVYPFLMDGRFVARVDLKADRASSTLLVKAAWAEPGTEVPAGQVADALAGELAELGRWTGCAQVLVLPRGDLAGALANAVAAR